MGHSAKKNYPKYPDGIYTWSFIHPHDPRILVVDTYNNGKLIRTRNEWR